MSFRQTFVQRSREILSTAVLLVGVFSFRSSIAEPYQVPTGSMIPTILPGDRLWVLKASYDLKVPFTDVTLLKTGEPRRGDVIVFRYPPDPSLNYVKRLIGLPGDVITVRDGFIAVNGKPLSSELETRNARRTLLRETLEGRSYEVQRLPHPLAAAHDHPLGDNELTFRVPEQSYFFMGDNRDNSADSRYWGFMPRANLKGRAIGVWMSLDLDQPGLPVPRWDRIGKVL